VKTFAMSKNRVYSCNPRLKLLARILRLNSTMAEIILWKNIKGRALGYEFHRQVPIDEFIIDFYCMSYFLRLRLMDIPMIIILLRMNQDRRSWKAWV